MTSLVYPLKHAKRFDDFELRMSLRSVEANLLGKGEVWIIGHKPEWLTNVKHVPCNDPHSIPDRNICSKVIKACQQDEISDEFLFMNDDHYLLDFFEAFNFPFYSHRLSIAEYAKKRGLDDYGKRVMNTGKYLESNGLPTRMFDVHTPIRYKKTEFKEIMSDLPWDDYKQGFVVKSLYANTLKLDGVPYDDQKISSPPRNKIKIMSSTPSMKRAVQRFLLDLFPEPSKFEKFGFNGEPYDKVTNNLDVQTSIDK